MILFHSDLDNTLIYSYKHDIGTDKVCVEIYHEREASFMTKKSYELLKSIQDSLIFVPTTTRTIEQYNRIDFGIGIPKYALVCNGGILLENGVKNKAWYGQSLELVSECREEMEKAEAWLKHDENRTFEIRNIEELFLFTKSSKPDKSVQKLKEFINPKLADVFSNGVKVYVVPKKLSKGMAVRRLKQWVKADMVIAAGDSEFDIPMINEADIAFAPQELIEHCEVRSELIPAERESIFSDTILEYLSRETRR